MPQLIKGGKWVFGWCIVGPGGAIHIPPQAYNEYGFQTGETLLITRGSKRSGGIGIGRSEKLGASILQSRCIGRTTMQAGGCVILPLEAGIQPGERLLAVRGSGLALGFVQRGPILEEALKHPEIDTFLS
ncbi:MAG: hypothetical protein JW726_11990 [Anaerolineales bacterium]|nr:hypothetical protein [Anaerolineales bacterium]